MAHPSRRSLLLSGGAAVLGADVLGEPGDQVQHGTRYDLDTGRVTLVG